MQQLLDLIVNEEMDKANDLFHEIVVEKSREIYENLIAEEEDEDEDQQDESMKSDDEEDDDQQDEDIEEGFGMEDETSMDVGDDAEEHDPAGALMHDTEMGHDDDGEFGGEEGGESPATKDDIQDLEDALAELKAEFEALMGDEGKEHDGEEAEFGHDDEESDDEESDDEESDDEESDDEYDDQDESMGVVREYRETVGNDWNTGKQKEQGKALGANTGETYPAPSEGKSPVSSGTGKPTTGATAHNILGNSGKGAEGTNTGTATNADKGSRGLVGGTKGEFTKGVEKNIARSSTAAMKDGAKLEKNTAGHGAERKGGSPGPVGSGSGDKAGKEPIKRCS